MSKLEHQQFIFGSILLLSNKLQLLGDQVTKELTLKQWFLLNLISNMENKHPNFMEVAKVMGTSRQNVSKMLSVLEKKGMVDVKPSNADHRAIYVELTQQSLDYFESMEQAGNDLLTDIFSNFQPEEIEQLATSLERMMTTIEMKLKKQERK